MVTALDGSRLHTSHGRPCCGRLTAARSLACAAVARPGFSVAGGGGADLHTQPREGRPAGWLQAPAPGPPAEPGVVARPAARPRCLRSRFDRKRALTPAVGGWGGGCVCRPPWTPRSGWTVTSSRCFWPRDGWLKSASRSSKRTRWPRLAAAALALCPCSCFGPLPLQLLWPFALAAAFCGQSRLRLTKPDVLYLSHTLCLLHVCILPVSSCYVCCLFSALPSPLLLPAFYPAPCSRVSLSICAAVS